MQTIVDLLQQLTQASIQLLVQPFYYIGILLVILLYRRQMILERKMFHTRIHPYMQQAGKALLWGIAAGFTVSLVMLFVGTQLKLETVYLLWIITILLLLFRVRFFAFIYAIGIVGLLFGLYPYLPQSMKLGKIEVYLDAVMNLKYSSMLAILSLLIAIEALYIYWKRTRSQSPVYVEGKRGRVVGGYQLQGFWIAPLFLLVPIESGAGISLPWTPLLWLGEQSPVGWMLVAVPMMFGISSMTKTMMPQVKAAWTAKCLLWFSLILASFAVIAKLWSHAAVYITLSVLLIVIYEIFNGWSHRQEEKKSPIYVHDERGLFILGILPDSPAKELGILAGELVYKVNGVKVNNQDDLHTAFRESPAFYKLEIINLEGQVKFLQRAVFAGDHYQLGMIFAPNEATDYYISSKTKSTFSKMNAPKSGPVEG